MVPVQKSIKLYLNVNVDKYHGIWQNKRYFLAICLTSKSDRISRWFESSYLKYTDRWINHLCQESMHAQKLLSVMQCVSMINENSLIWRSCPLFGCNCLTSSSAFGYGESTTFVCNSRLSLKNFRTRPSWLHVFKDTHRLTLLSEVQTLPWCTRYNALYNTVMWFIW
jgi:hypothetical protein